VTVRSCGRVHRCEKTIPAFAARKPHQIALHQRQACHVAGRPNASSAESSATSLDFTSRADLVAFPELMDGPCSYEDLRACLHDIARVNRLTHAYSPTFQWLNHFYKHLPVQKKPLHIVDVGCGYGDMLRRIRQWADDRGLPVILTGIDLNPDAIRAAREVTIPGTVTFLAGNAYDFKPSEGIDLVISSLLTHHLGGDEIVAFLQWMEAVARMGWFINDLHRQPVPYYAFKALTLFTSWHRFVKHDGPVSILRSFRPEEWRQLVQAAGLLVNEVQIREFPPARLCVARLR
jgi:SAM-dependent methyltransferase